MFYHPLSEAQHKKSLSCFHTCSCSRRYNTENFPQFLHGAHEHKQVPCRIDENKDERIFLLCQTCESDGRFNCVSAIFSRTENAHQRNFLMLLTIKSKYLVMLSILLSWCKSTKGYTTRVRSCDSVKLPLKH